MFELSKKIVLASGSPRRQQLLSQMGFEFEVQVTDVDETLPAGIKADEAAAYLAELKAGPFLEQGIRNDQLIITCDTVVAIDDHIPGKPEDETDAKRMIKSLSGRSHRVISAYSIHTSNWKQTESDEVQVWFDKLSTSDIDYYIREFQPFDKAGAYGIQEWIGLIGIERIEGSFYTVMGLPTLKLYRALKKFAQ